MFDVFESTKETKIISDKTLHASGEMRERGEMILDGGSVCERWRVGLVWVDGVLFSKGSSGVRRFWRCIRWRKKGRWMKMGC